jgi:hypothetical protein
MTMAKEMLLQNVDEKHGVRIEREFGGIYLSITMNGWQWTSLEVDETLARMISSGLLYVSNEGVFRQSEDK